jgi:signal transduction histidine kinase
VDSPSPREDAAPPDEALRKLQAVTDVALAHLSADALLDELLTRVRDILEADTCAVLLLDGSGTELVARAAKGLEEEVDRGVRIPVGKGFAGKVAAERRPIVIDDVDHADLLNPVLRERGVKSLLGVPLLAGDDVLGVIHVGTLQPRRFTAEDVELLEIVAHRVSLAVERALIYDERVRMTQLQRDFVALAAHELRTPATAIYGLATTLRRRGGELRPEMIEHLQDTLYQQADRMRRLVEQLLDLSRLEAATIEIAPQRIRLRGHIEQIVETVAVADDGAVLVDVDPDLQVEVDPTTLERVVTNLVGNALRHGAPPVRVTGAQQDKHLRVAVEDRGRGVGDDFVPFLFDRFRRSDDSLRDGWGAGLGLAIARSYARAHGGDLFYAPAEPTGARFELVLPASPVNA